MSKATVSFVFPTAPVDLTVVAASAVMLGSELRGAS
jgi:hypothetical protein